MSEGFIRTRHGALNLRYVRRIYEVTDHNGRNSHTAVTDDESEYHVDLGTDVLENLCQRLIPASSEDRACLLSFDDNNPTVEGIWEQHLKIIAWGISTNYAGGCYGVAPIFADNPAQNQVALIRCPDGSWLLQEDRTFATLDQAKRELLADRLETKRMRQNLQAYTAGGDAGPDTSAETTAGPTTLAVDGQG